MRREAPGKDLPSLAPSAKELSQESSASTLFLGRGGWCVVHVFLHARFVAGLRLLHFGLLIRGQYLKQFVVDTRLLHRQLGLDLCLLHSQGADFGFVVRALRILAKLQIDLVGLLEQWLYHRMFLLQDGLDLRLLGIRSS